jgi:hypothetical protein
MNRWVFLIILVVLASIPARVVAQMPKDVAIAKGEAILKNLQDGRTADVVKEFDAKMTEALPEAKLKPVWSSLVAQFGAFKQIDERREGQVQGRQAVELILSFQKETVVQRLVFDGEGKVSGIVFQPMSMAVLPPGK